MKTFSRVPAVTGAWKNVFMLERMMQELRDLMEQDRKLRMEIKQKQDALVQAMNTANVREIPTGLGIYELRLKSPMEPRIRTESIRISPFAKNVLEKLKGGNWITKRMLAQELGLVGVPMHLHQSINSLYAKGLIEKNETSIRLK